MQSVGIERLRECYVVKMSDLPLITVGVACFNACDTIERAVQSGCAQIWENLEILIVDDGSTDGSLELIERLAKEDDRVRVVRNQENAGIGSVRNTIVDHANGEFIAFFDDDDESLPDRLKRQYERICAYEESTKAKIVVCHTARTQVFPDAAERYEMTYGARFANTAPNGPKVAERVLIGRPDGHGSGPMATCSQMARKLVYQSVGGFDPSLRRSEDTDFIIRVAFAGGHFVGIEEPLVRQHITVSSEKSIEAERRYSLMWLDKHRNFLEQIGWFDHARLWLDIKYDYLGGHRLRFFMRMLWLFVCHPVRTPQRLLWTFPNRQHSRAAAELVRKFHQR